MSRDLADQGLTYPSRICLGFEAYPLHPEPQASRLKLLVIRPVGFGVRDMGTRILGLGSAGLRGSSKVYNRECSDFEP